MRVARILLCIGFFAVATVVAAAIFFLKSIDLNRHRALIVQQVTAATGRQLTLAGDAEFAFSLAPMVVIDDVAFANAEWGSRPAMITARRIEARIELLPLLFGDLRIKYLVLVDPEVLIETDAEGGGNWLLGRAETLSGEAAAIPGIGELRVRGGHVAYVAGTTGAVHELAIERLDATARNLDSPIEMSFAGTYNGQTFSVSGTLGALSRLGGDGSYPFALEGETEGIQVSLDGRMERPLALGGLDVTVALSGEEIADLTPFVGRELPPLGPYDLRLQLSEPGGRYRVSDLTARVGRRGGLFIEARGAIDNLLAGRGLDLSFAVEASDLATLGALAAVELPPLGPVAARGRLRDGEGAYAFDDLAVAIGASDLSGTVIVDATTAPPRFDAEVSASSLDLRELLPAPVADPSPAVAADTQAAGTSEDSGLPERLFSDALLPFDALGGVDVDVALDAGHVIFEGAIFDDVAIDMSLAAGEIEARLARASYSGATLSAEAFVDARGDIARLRLHLEAAGLDVGRFLSGMEVTDLIEGRADIVIDVEGGGNSVRDIMAGLDGRARLLMDGGRIDSSYIDYIATDLVGEILSDSADDTDTKFNCFVGRFDIAEGLATSQGLLFDTERMTIVGEGTVDLGAETLDLILKPEPKDASLISLATPMHVEGALAAPGVRPDTIAVARTAAGALLGALATGGFGFIVPFINIGGGDESPCVAALDAAEALPADASGDGQVEEPGNGGSDGFAGAAGKSLKALSGGH